MSSSGRVSATSSSTPLILRLTPFSTSPAHIRLPTVDPVASYWHAFRTACTTALMTPGLSWWHAYMRFAIRSIIAVGRVASKRLPAETAACVR